MANLEDYRLECGWSKNEMARQASMDLNTLNRALNGVHVSLATGDKLATAISRKLGRIIRIRDIDGLNVK
jgi:transcriptional regulator with XRE-family HTH domain